MGLWTKIFGYKPTENEIDYLASTTGYLKTDCKEALKKSEGDKAAARRWLAKEARTGRIHSTKREVRIQDEGRDVYEKRVSPSYSSSRPTGVRPLREREELDLSGPAEDIAYAGVDLTNYLTMGRQGFRSDAEFIAEETAAAERTNFVPDDAPIQVERSAPAVHDFGAGNHSYQDQINILNGVGSPTTQPTTQPSGSNYNHDEAGSPNCS